MKAAGLTICRRIRRNEVIEAPREDDDLGYRVVNRLQIRGGDVMGRCCDELKELAEGLDRAGRNGTERGRVRCGLRRYFSRDIRELCAMLVLGNSV
jgi:hypothetical protein